MSTRCSTGCGKWSFKDGLCRNCSANAPAKPAPEIVKSGLPPDESQGFAPPPPKPVFEGGRGLPVGWSGAAVPARAAPAPAATPAEFSMPTLKPTSVPKPTGEAHAPPPPSTTTPADAPEPAPGSPRRRPSIERASMDDLIKPAWAAFFEAQEVGDTVSTYQNVMASRESTSYCSGNRRQTI